MFVTNSEAYARRAALMRLHGMTGDAWKRYSKEGSWFYDVVEAGFKMNLPDILAAIGLAQLRKADLFHQRRSRIASTYLRHLTSVEELEMPPTRFRRTLLALVYFASSSWHAHKEQKSIHRRTEGSRYRHKCPFYPFAHALLLPSAVWLCERRFT